MIFRLACKRLVRKRSAFLLLLLLPLSILGVSLLLPKGSLSLPAAAVFADISQPKTAVLTQKLCADPSAFQLAESEEALLQGVKSGTYDCGFVLHSDMETALEKGKRVPPVTLYTSPLSLRSEVFRMRFSSAFLSEISPLLCREVLEKYGVAVTQQELFDKLAEHAAREDRFAIETQSVDGVSLETDTAAVTGRAFLFGLLALFLCAASLVYASLYAPSRLQDIRQLVAEKPLWLYVLLPSFAAETGLLSVFGLGSLALLPLFGIPAKALDFGALFCYILFLSGLSLFLAAVFPKAHQIVWLMVPVLCFSLLLCPILIDLPKAFPALAFPAWLLPTHMLFFFLEKGGPAPFLIAAGSVLAGFTALFIRLHICRRTD